MPEATTKVLLSDKYAKTAEPSTRHWDSKTAGFFLQTGKAAKTWYLEHRGQRHNLGRYPDVSASDARAHAATLMAPSANVELAPTLEEALVDYITHGGRGQALRSSHNKRSVDSQMRMHMAKFLKRRLHTITKQELRAHHATLQVQRIGKDSLGRKTTIGGERAANHVMQSFRTIWNHARDFMMEGELKTCPTVALRISDTGAKGDDVEIIESLDAWREQIERIDPMHRAFYRLLLHTGMRKTELLSLRWDQVEDDRIHLPETKNGRPFDIPLEPEHREILEWVRSMRRPDVDWVFWSAKGDGHLKTPQKIVVDGKVATAHMHRRTFATYGEKAGLAPWQVGQLLNHTLPGVTSKKYIRTELDHYRPFMRLILDALPA